MFTLDSNYAWVLFTVGVIATQCLLDGFASGGLRQKLFNKEFFAKHFPELKDKIPNEGYPDMGNGLFAHKLSVHDWMKFNNIQRAHYNGLEQLALVMFSILSIGLIYPRIAFLMGWLYVIGRFFYSRGYRSDGPQGRLFGVRITGTVLMCATFTSLYLMFASGGGASGFIKLVQG